MTDIDSHMLKYRKEKFAVEVNPARDPIEEGEIVLSVTHNGFQWSALSLLQSEIDAVIAALQAAKK